MNVSSITLNENCKPRRNMFIKYSNSFMSMMNGGSEAVEKAQKVNPSNDKKLDKSMGIETLTIFPKQVIDGKLSFLRRSMILKIFRMPHNRFVPEYKTEGAAGMDLCAAIEEEITLQPLERKLIPTGLKIELEHGYEAQIRPRSGLSIKHGISLINCVGTIDEDYRGEVCIPVVNLSNEAYTIKPDERIAQMIIAKYEQAKIEVVTELSETERGAGGFGSTGKI